MILTKTSINHVGTINISTVRLLLRKATLKDAQSLFSGLLNQPEFLYYTNKNPKSLNDTKEYLTAVQEKYSQKDYYNWIIEDKQTKNIVGMLNLRVMNKKQLR